MKFERYAPYLVAAVLALLWLRSHDARVRAEARAEIQADSLAREIDSLASRERDRETRRAEIQKASAARADSLRGLRRELRHLTAAGDTAGAALQAHADRDTLVSDSLRGLIRLTLGIMDRSARACNAALGTCDSIIAGKDALISQLDSSRVEFHTVMHRTEELWAVDRKRLRRERRDLSLCGSVGYGLQAGGTVTTGWTASVGVCYRLIALPPW